MDRKEYMRKYYQEHKEKIIERKKEWLKNNPEWKKEYYQKNKDKFRKNTKEWINKSEENRKRFIKSCNESRRRRVERLREQGCKNAWNVVNYKAEPKYKEI